MRFYLNNLSNRVYVEVAPQITETFDESLDSATVSLKANDNPISYAPNQYFYICDDNDNILYTMTLALDMVETYSSKPLKYRHVLTLTQNSRNISKSTVRNSVFTQPMSEYKKGYTAINNSFNYGYSGDDTQIIDWRVPNSKDGNENIWTDGINLNEKDRIQGDLTINLVIWGIYHNSNDNSAHIFKVTSLSDLGNNNNIRLRLIRNGVFTNQEVVLTNEMLNSKIVIDSFSSYIKNNPTGLYTISLANTVYAIDNNVKNNATCFVMQINYSLQVYYFNCYDLLELLVKRQQQKNLRYSKVKLFTLPESGELHDLLVNTIPPNFTFTASTMYECIADIFKLFDAIFTIDNNNVLGIEYLNEYQQQNTLEVSSTRSTQAEENYNRGIVNFYQDARVLERFPSGKGYAKARSSGLGVPTSTNDFCILLPHKIEYIDKVEMLNANISIYLSWLSSGSITHGTSNLNYDDDVVLDLSHYVLESSIYGLLSSGDESTIANENQNLLQMNTTYYQKGDNKINLGLTYQNGTITSLIYYNFATIVLYAFYRFFGLKYWGGQSTYAGSAIPNRNNYYSNNFTNIKTAVTYMASVDGKLEIESINPKYNGEIFVDQSNGAVDLNKLGLNMYGLALKLGEPTLTKTMQIVDFSNRIRKGQYIIENGEKWIANVITHTILDGGKVQSVVNFVKNYNALSLFTRVNKEKRMSTIAPELINKSEVLFGEYLYFSSETLPYSYQTETKMVTTEICSLFYSTFQYDESETHRVDYAIVSSYDNTSSPYTFNDNGVTRNVENVAIPLVRYGSGNSICLEASFSHPKSAGNKTTNDYQWWGGSSYFTNFVPYTDDNGFVDKIDYKLYYKVVESDLDNYPIIDTTNDDTLIIDLSKLEIFKYPNEIFAINYQIHLLPVSTRKDIDFVGSAFINNNAMVKNPEAKNFYIYVSDSYKYSILDTKGQGTRHLITSVGYHTTNMAFDLTFEYNEIDVTDIISWAICDESGNIYFASNTQPGSESSKLYFATRNQRIEDNQIEYLYRLSFTVGQNVVVYGNIGAQFVSYRPGTVVDIPLQDGTPYHLYISLPSEHWYSDESGWEEESGIVNRDINLGTTSNGIQMSKFTIVWEKYIKAITIGDTTYNNPDPSDSFFYRTEVWSKKGLSLSWSVSDIQNGYYPSESGGTWNTDNDIYKDISALKYTTFTITFHKGVHYVVFTLDGESTSYYNPYPMQDDGGTTTISNVEQGLTYSWETHPVTNWQIDSGGTGSGTTDGTNISIEPQASAIMHTFKIKAGGNVTITGTIGGESVTIRANQEYEQDWQQGTTYDLEVTCDDEYYYFPSGSTTSYNGTIDSDTDLGTTVSALAYRTITINFGAFVQRVILTLDGVDTTYYNPSRPNAGTTTISKVEQGLAYSYTSYAETNYQIDTDETGSGNTSDGDVTISPTASAIMHNFKIKAGVNVTVTGTIGGQSITLRSNQTYDVDWQEGTTYDLEVTCDTTNYYFPEGAILNYSGTINSDIDLGTTVSAASYRKVVINFGAGVQRVVLTLGGVATTYYNPNRPNAGTTTVSQIKQGVAYSWTTYPETNYQIDSGSSGSGTITSSDITINTTASLITYNFKIKAGNNVTITGNIGGQSVTIRSNVSYEQTLPIGTTYSLTVSPNDSSYYIPSGSTTSYSGTINADVDLGTTVSALAYRTFTINWRKGVSRVVFNGTSYYNPYPNQADGGVKTIGSIEQGQTLSYSSHPVNNYEIISYISGTWNTSSGDLTITPTANFVVRLTEIQFGRSSISTNHILYLESLYFNNPSGSTISVSVNVKRYTSGAGTSGGTIDVGTYSSSTSGGYVSLSGIQLNNGSYSGDRYKITITMTIGNVTTQITIGCLVNEYVSSNGSSKIYLYSVTADSQTIPSSSISNGCPIGGAEWWFIDTNTWSNTHS